MRYCCLSVLFLLYPTINAQISMAELDRLNNMNEDNPADIADIANKTYIEEQTALQKHILNGYDRHSRPTSDLSKPTIVNIHLTILHFSVQEKQQSITFYGHMYMTWFDEKAVWNPADFNNVRTTHVSQWEIWQPDIKTANSISGVNKFFEISKRSHAMLTSMDTHTTKVEVFPTYSITVGCDFDFEDYPFDVQNCTVRLYTHLPMNEVDVKVYFDEKPSITLSWDKQNKKVHISNWQLIDVQANTTYFRNRDYDNSAPQTPEEASVTWPIIQYAVTIKRNAYKYWFTLALSGSTSMWLNTLSFLIYRSETAITLIIGNFFIQVVFMYDAVDLIPVSGGSRPNVVSFTTLLLVFTLLALVLQFCLKLFAETLWTPPQSFLRVSKQIQHHFLNFINSTEPKEEVEANEEHEVKLVDSNKIESVLVGRLLRRICVVFYFLLSLVLCPLLFM
ncbi:hypothetical protein M3Y94_00321900 [Aphelenchoides besseyi]|nr:hypothetical protein M3Y94_00321900 [Aphelenchoides besseyi]KAI6235630.1 Acetylcholine receptor-like protein cup-4 [Aphelenchoides besseyi]